VSTDSFHNMQRLVHTATTLRYYRFTESRLILRHIYQPCTRCYSNEKQIQNEQSNEQSNEKSNEESNEESNEQSNKKSNEKSNEESNEESIKETFKPEEGPMQETYENLPTRRPYNPFADPEPLDVQQLEGGPNSPISREYGAPIYSITEADKQAEKDLRAKILEDAKYDQEDKPFPVWLTKIYGAAACLLLVLLVYAYLKTRFSKDKQDIEISMDITAINRAHKIRADKDASITSVQTIKS
jgi:DNA mismatch repair ATPase MutL